MYSIFDYIASERSGFPKARIAATPTSEPLSFDERIASYFGVEPRVVISESEPLICVKDLAKCLGVVNHKRLIARLKASERFIIKARDAAGRMRPMVYTTEKGFFKILSKSSVNNLKANKFKRWLHNEILPAISMFNSLTADLKNVKARKVAIDEYNKLMSEFAEHFGNHIINDRAAKVVAIEEVLKKTGYALTLVDQ